MKLTNSCKTSKNLIKTEETPKKNLSEGLKGLKRRIKKKD